MKELLPSTISLQCRCFLRDQDEYEVLLLSVLHESTSIMRRDSKLVKSYHKKTAPPERRCSKDDTKVLLLSEGITNLGKPGVAAFPAPGITKTGSQ